MDAELTEIMKKSLFDTSKSILKFFGKILKWAVSISLYIFVCGFIAQLQIRFLPPFMVWINWGLLAVVVPVVIWAIWFETLLDKRYGKIEGREISPEEARLRRMSNESALKFIKLWGGFFFGVSCMYWILSS